MDILDLIRNSINTLPDGQHRAGLSAVLRHIEVAYKHLERGQTCPDDSAFTDCVYRTNQAFEGSIKEAYRVLTNSDPQNKRPYEIEEHLIQNKVFRDRIIAQLKTYRKDWRNPSTHDYTLDFNESEAFLAIVSVSAFVKLLVDQIAEHLSKEAVEKDAEKRAVSGNINVPSNEALVDRVTNVFKLFATQYANNLSIPIESESQLQGALLGFLASVAPELNASTGRIFKKEFQSLYVDMVISGEGQQIVIELKRGQHRALMEQGLHKVERYIDGTKASGGILFLYSAKAQEYEIEKMDTLVPSRKIRVIRPKI